MPDEETLTIRLATPDDAALIAEHRALLFESTGKITSEDVPAMERRLQPQLYRMLRAGEYIGWLAEAAGGKVVAGAGVQLRTLLPRPETAIAREALVVNVYVWPDYRRRGLARRLMLAVLDWSREQGIERVALHASTMGRPLYESLGFTASNEMVIYVRS
jgi:GNAT superfamily N-acetyltransferase